MGKRSIEGNGWFRVSFTITVCLVISLLLITEARAENVTYGYDELGRLIRVTYENGTEITYTYDQVGNRQTKTVQIVAESVSTPSTPAGPANGDIGTSYAYSTGGAESNFGHSLEYKFDWGDGTDSGWLPVGQTGASHSWGLQGNYPVKAQARCSVHPSVVSIWSGTFSVSIILPAATLISPSGTITDTTPTYTWNAVPSATYYQLYVNDMTGNRIQQWYTADACGCASGTGTCSITPTTEVVGSCIWYIQSYNGAGYSPWSSGLSFTTPIPTPPSEATLISPSGVILEATPTYRWNPVSNSTWYCLYVNDSTGNKINQWYAAADAGCPDGVGTCSVTPTIALAAGAGQWYIRTYNSSGYGPWSAPMAFTVTTPTLISPSGTIATFTPTYTWNALSTATDYYLWVNDSTGNRIQQWYTAADAGCASGTGTCSVTPATALIAGACQWWLKAKNTSGEGPWSTGMPFTIPAPGAATLISPSGTITDTTPTYTWNAVPISTHYYLWVNDSTGNRIQQWYTAADCGCSSGTGTCSVTPSTVLNPGACSWWIQTYNNAGYGPWSSGMSFTVSP